MGETTKIEWAREMFFPEPLNEKYYLWAHHWEDLENGRWSHPGHGMDEDAETEAIYAAGGFTTAQAIKETQQTDGLYVRIANAAELRGKPFAVSSCKILWTQGARYQWLCEFGTTRDPADVRDQAAWAKDRLPPVDSAHAAGDPEANEQG